MRDKIVEFFDISLELALFLLVLGMLILSAISREPTTAFTPEFSELCVNMYDC